MFFNSITKDDKVEIIATFMGSFILGGSFAKDFFMNGKFEGRIFFFGISSLVLFLAVSIFAQINIKLFNSNRKILSLFWWVLFLTGTVATVELFKFQFNDAYLKHDIRLTTMVFLVCYGSSTNLLYFMNRQTILEHLKLKTAYKYLLAPINGISLGVIITGIIVWTFYSFKF
jgi:hypothetical protein